MAIFRRLWARPTGDILVLVIALTISCTILFITMATVAFVFINPGKPIDAPARIIADVTNTLIGLLAGFLAGTSSTWKRPLSEGQPEQNGVGQQYPSQRDTQGTEGQQ